ncbi:glycosyltransferase family 9 protein [Bacteroidota bacterium]
MIKKTEIFIRKIITRLFLLALKAKPVSSMPQISNQTRVVLVTLNRIGDALITTSFIQVLKEKTGCSITLLAGKNNHFVFDSNPHCDDLILYEKGIAGIVNTIKKINRGNYNVVIDLHDDVSTTVTLLVAFSKVKFKCGLKKRNEKIYTHTVEKLNPINHHVIDRLMKFTDLFGIGYNREEVNIVYKCKDNSIRKAEDFITNNFEKKKFIIGINISAGSDARFWGVHRFKKLYDFLQNYDINLVLIAAQKDLHFANQITTGKLKIFCSPSFDEFAAMISKLNFLFTPDTSAVHLASAYHVPVFGIYARYFTQVFMSVCRHCK